MSTNPFQSAVEQVKKIRPYLKMTDLEFEKLTTHDQVVERSFTIKLDNGEEKIFRGLRAQHNNALGPYKGGLRFHPLVTREEVMALSMWMTWKTAIAGLPLGGGKGGVVVDPKTLSNQELKRLSKAFARRFVDVWGSTVDVPAPDVNTNPDVMKWMVEECKLIKGKDVCRATYTGKPIDEGGSSGRVQATGRGGFIVLDQLAKHTNLIPKETTIAVQGVGNVAYWFARLAIESGYKVVAISDSKGGLTNLPKEVNLDRIGETPKFESIDLEKVLAYKEKHGSLANFPEYRQISNQELLALPVDVLAPAALDGVITEENMDDIQAKMIIELANGPITAEAEEYLNGRNLIIVPDILANAGGVTVSYFEWLQNLKHQVWSEEKVNSKLEKTLVKAFGEIWKTYQSLSKKHPGANISLKQAAYVLSLKKVLFAMRKSQNRD